MAVERQIVVFTFYSRGPEYRFLDLVKRRFAGIKYDVKQRPLSPETRARLNPEIYPSDRTFGYDFCMEEKELRKYGGSVLRHVRELAHAEPQTVCTSEALKILSRK